MRDLGEIVLIAGFSFLLGFKIAARMGRRHLERMKAIWLGRGEQPGAAKEG